MLQLNLSASLAKRLKVALAGENNAKQDTSALLVWAARDFQIGTQHFVLFVNPKTTLPFVLDAAPYATLAERFASALPGYLESHDWKDARATLAPLLAEGTVYRRNSDRSVTGAMNEYIFHLKNSEGVRSLLGTESDTHRLSHRIADMPTGIKQVLRFPQDRLHELVGMEPRDGKHDFTAPPSDLFSYTSRKGTTYFVHERKTSTGKPNFYVATQSKGALRALSEQLEVTESINGVVSVKRKGASPIPNADLEVVRNAVAAIPRLKHYRVATQGRTIVIYEPLSLHAAEAMLEDPSRFSMLNELDRLRSMFSNGGAYADQIMNDMAAKAGLTLAQWRVLDIEHARAKAQAAADRLLADSRYEVVLRFTLSRRGPSYAAERRHWRSHAHGTGWLHLSDGAISTLANNLVRHIATERFYELGAE